MSKVILLNEEKDIGKIIGDAFLFLRFQFWNYLNCLFITTAPFFILYILSYYSKINNGIDENNWGDYANVGNLSGVLGVIGLLNMSNVYMLVYSTGQTKIKVSQLTKVISENVKAFLQFNITLLFLLGTILFVLLLINKGVSNSTWYYYALSTFIVLLASFGLIFWFQLNAANLLALRENKGLIKSYLIVFVYSKKNKLLIWLVTVIAVAVAFVLRLLSTLPLKIIDIIGNASNLYAIEPFLNSFPTLNIVLNVFMTMFAVFISTFLLIAHQVLFFSLEEKYKGAGLINQINHIGDI
jgi:hypothetical protein